MVRIVITPYLSNHESRITYFLFLCLRFIGSTEPVKVDTLLMKVSNKKRKVNNCPVETVSSRSKLEDCIV